MRNEAENLEIFFYITSTRAIYIWALKAIRDCTEETMSPPAMKCNLNLIATRS